MIQYEQSERDKAREAVAAGIRDGIDEAKRSAPQFAASLKLDPDAIAAFQKRYPDATIPVRLKKSTSIRGYKGMQPIGKEVLVSQIDFEYLTIVHAYAEEIKDVSLIQSVVKAARAVRNLIL